MSYNKLALMHIVEFYIRHKTQGIKVALAYIGLEIKCVYYMLLTITECLLVCDFQNRHPPEHLELLLL